MTIRALDNAMLRALQTPRELALHLRDLSKKIPTEEMTRHLLESIRSEALPSDCFATYLVAVESPPAVVAALRQPFSRFLRYSATKQFGRVMKTQGWEAVWDALGGTPGLLALFNELSVVEVDFLCKVIGWSAQWPGSESTEKQRRITQFLQGLLPDLYPNAPFQTEDERPLVKCYASLVPACTSEFVGKMLVNNDNYEGPFQWDKWRVRRIAQYHWPMLQQLVLDTLGREKHQPKPEVIAEGEAAESLSKCFLPHLLAVVPQVPGHEPGFSASMSFSLKVLRKLAAGAEAHYLDGDFQSNLVIPLMRRAIEGKAGTESIREIINLTLAYLDHHPYEACKNSHFIENSFPAYVAKAWSIKPEILELQLIAVISRQSYGISKTFSAFMGILKMVKMEQRYRLLQLIALYSDGLGFDIDNDHALESCPIKEWPTSIFLNLPSDYARDLLQRLIRLKPDGHFLQPLSSHRVFSLPSILLQLPAPQSNYGDPKLLLLVLSAKGNDVSGNASAAVEKYKEKAFKSREQTERAFYARSATFYAVASGSLDLFAQVVTWLNRYRRDPLTAKAIYSNGTMNTKEGIALLSGIPSTLSIHGKHQISEMVIQANKILVDLFETGTLAMNEPFFSSQDWAFLKESFSSVVRSRMAQSHGVKKSLNLTDDEIYDVLWIPTIDMLLRVEEVALLPANNTLGLNLPNGLLRWPPLFADNAAANRFVDDMAMARDQLWQKHRLTLHSECATLPKIWPRGLPLQCLVGIQVNTLVVRAAKPFIPFISSRAHEIVMIQQNPLVNEDTLNKEQRDAIGEFVDSYELALQIDVLQQMPGKGQRDRTALILAQLLRLNRKDVLEVGGKTRLSEMEALRFWEPIFRRALPSVQVTAFDEVEKQERGYPTLPPILIGMNPQERLEWDPNEGKPRAVKPRELSSTLIDCMLTSGSTVGYGLMNIPKVYTSNIQPPHIWSRERLVNLKSKTESVKDGTLVSALLFLASKTRNKPTILLSAFPSQQDARYLPLFLDQDFLESAKDEVEEAQEAISYSMYRAPSTLLRAIVTNALSASFDEKVTAAERPAREKFAYNLLKLLSQTDRPDLASHDILHIILDRPDSSSWHRYLLTKNFLRRLSKAHAQELVQYFAASLDLKLDEQRAIRAKQRKDVSSLSQSASDPPSKPLIKVTTVKFWAQFLNDTDAIPAKDSIQLLSCLLQKSDHIDVRVAVVSSLLSRLSACKEESESEEHVLYALKDLVAVIGGINERQQLDEKDWQRAEETGDLLEISDDGATYTIPPTLATVFAAFNHGGDSYISRQKRTKLLYRVLLPAVQRSKENNMRWIHMYVQKNRPQEQPHLSSIILPLKPNILALLLKSSVSQMPSWILEDYQRYVLVNIQPPSWLASMNRSILTNAERRETNESQHWLSLFNRGPDAIHTAGLTVANLLSEPWKPSTVHTVVGIELAHIQKCVVEQALALLRINDPDFTHWKRLVTCLYPPLRGSNQIKQAWLANTRPVLTQLVIIITKLRDSSTWQRRSDNNNPKDRGYRFLPPTFPLRLQLLDHPHLSEKQDTGRFASQLLALLSEIQHLGLAHHSKLQDIADAALSVEEGSSRIRLACRLGDINSHYGPHHRGDPKTSGSSSHRAEKIPAVGEDDVEAENFLILRTELADRLLERVAIEDLNVRGGATATITRTYTGGDSERVHSTGAEAEEEEEEEEEEEVSDRSFVECVLRSWARSTIEEVWMRGVRSARRLNVDVDGDGGHNGG